MHYALRTVHVLAAIPRCPQCGAGPYEMCREANEVHLRRTVRIAANAATSDVIAGAWRVVWAKPDGRYLLWVSIPARPHLVISQWLDALPEPGQAFLKVWAPLEISLGLAAERDLCPPISPAEVGSRDRFGCPGALPPAPLPSWLPL